MNESCYLVFWCEVTMATCGGASCADAGRVQYVQCEAGAWLHDSTPLLGRRGTRLLSIAMSSERKNRQKSGNVEKLSVLFQMIQIKKIQLQH